MSKKSGSVAQNPARGAKPENPATAPLPHERDESPSKEPAPPKKIVQQAFKDLSSGQEDTDLHNLRTQETKKRTP